MKETVPFLLAAAAILLAPTRVLAGTKYIIHNQAGNTLSSRTSYIIQNKSYIDTLPFDGITINVPDTWGLLAPGNVASYNNSYAWLSPLKGVLQKVTHNYLKIVARPCADPFDDWTQTINNWVIAAQASRDAGLEGIFFDNEEYYEPMWTYPRSVKYGSTKTLQQYQAQYRYRGYQLMKAITAQWPAVKIITAHGPYASMSATPAYVSMSQIGCSDNDLRGCFFAGMFSGEAQPGQIIDGGEVYQYRSRADFLNSYNWRCHSIVSFISCILASNIGFGFFDQQWLSDYPMDPKTFQSCITNGVLQADSVVWTYAEKNDYLTPGAVKSTWINAIWAARQAAGLPNP